MLLLMPIPINHFVESLYRHSPQKNLSRKMFNPRPVLPVIKSHIQQPVASQRYLQQSRKALDQRTANPSTLDLSDRDVKPNDHQSNGSLRLRLRDLRRPLQTFRAHQHTHPTATSRNPTAASSANIPSHSPSKWQITHKKQIDPDPEHYLPLLPPRRFTREQQ